MQDLNQGWYPLLRRICERFISEYYELKEVVKPKERTVMKPKHERRVRAALDGFWDRQQQRKAKRRAQAIAPRTKRPAIPASRQEHQLVLNALAEHERIIEDERKRTYLKEWTERYGNQMERKTA